MSEPALEVEDLGKTYDVPVRPPGVRAALVSLFKRETRQVVAVDALRFAVESGEIVGFLGPNGAGKTTTLKMLSGLLYPSRGTARVLGSVTTPRAVYFSGGWVEVSVLPVGNTVSVRMVRQDTGEFLNDQGRWQAGEGKVWVYHGPL